MTKAHVMHEVIPLSLWRAEDDEAAGSLMPFILAPRKGDHRKQYQKVVSERSVRHQSGVKL